MPELLSPRVFIQELKSDQQAVPGVSTSNFATVGWLPRGPENKATLVGSLAEYFRIFGGYWKNSDVPLAVTAFFQNDGARAYIVRVVPTDAVEAQTVIGANLWTSKISSSGAWGNLQQLVIVGNKNSYNTATATYSKFDVQIQEESALGANDFEVKELFEGVDLTDPDSPDYFPLVLNEENTGSKICSITTVSGGIPSDFASVSVSGESHGTGTGGASQVVSFTAAQPAIANFTLKLAVNGAVVAVDDGKGKVKLAPGVAGYTSIAGTVNYATGAVSVTFTPAPASGQTIRANYYKKGTDAVAYPFTGGFDGTSVTKSDVTDVSLVASKQGIYALNAIDQMLNIGLPDFAGNVGAMSDLISYCEGRKDAFAILDPGRGLDPQDAVNFKQVSLQSLSSYAAMYYPGIKIQDPLKNGKIRVMSNVGHIAGIYARTDNNRNVGKAPAGVNDGALKFAAGLERDLEQSDRDVVYPVNINPLISSPLTGRAVWGTRTLQISGDFNLVNVRRLFMFVEKSLFNATQDLLFEPIGEGLFTTVKVRFSSFLGGLAGLGYFASPLPSEAFRVVCDATNNTNDTIAQRMLIADVLLAAQTPAEFILLRFKRSLTAIK